MESVVKRVLAAAIVVLAASCGGGGVSISSGGGVIVTSPPPPPPPGPPPPPAGGLFVQPHSWTKDVSVFTKSSRSDAIIAALNSFGGWGNGNRLQIDFSIALLNADSATPRRTVTAPPGGYCFGGPDCDEIGRASCREREWVSVVEG